MENSRESAEKLLQTMNLYGEKCNMEKSSFHIHKQQSEDAIEEITLFTEKKVKILQD